MFVMNVIAQTAPKQQASGNSAVKQTDLRLDEQHQRKFTAAEQKELAQPETGNRTDGKKLISVGGRPVLVDANGTPSLLAPNTTK